MGILEYGAKFCAKKLDEMDRTQRYPIAVPSPEIVLHTDLPYCSGGDPHTGWISAIPQRAEIFRW